MKIPPNGGLTSIQTVRIDRRGECTLTGRNGHVQDPPNGSRCCRGGSGCGGVCRCRTGHDPWRGCRHRRWSSIDVGTAPDTTTSHDGLKNATTAEPGGPALRAHPPHGSPVGLMGPRNRLIPVTGETPTALASARNVVPAVLMADIASTALPGGPPLISFTQHRALTRWADPLTDLHRQQSLECW